MLFNVGIFFIENFIIFRNLNAYGKKRHKFYWNLPKIRRRITHAQYHSKTPAFGNKIKFVYQHQNVNVFVKQARRNHPTC